jgi:hypothetical protein
MIDPQALPGKGTKLLFQVVQAIINQLLFSLSLSTVTRFHWVVFHQSLMQITEDINWDLRCHLYVCLKPMSNVRPSVTSWNQVVLLVSANTIVTVGLQSVVAHAQSYLLGFAISMNSPSYHHQCDVYLRSEKIKVTFTAIVNQPELNRSVFRLNHQSMMVPISI